MNSKLEIIFFVLAGLVLVASIMWMSRTEQRLRKVFAGKKAKNLEDVIVTLKEEVHGLKTAKENAEREIALLQEQSKKSIRGLEIVRFNPFADQGSKQSFAIGMLNGEGDGLILSSLYSRENMSVFAKPVRRGHSEFELTHEEKEVLKKAEVR